jgi:SynChlorMet cassette radical SAM/SPASM protein ScmE
MEKARREGRDGIPGRGSLTGCNGAMSKMAVRADGVIVPCGQIPHLELGRVNRDDLREIWQSHISLQEIRQRRNIPLSSFEFCRGCEYLRYCTGNCPATAYTIIGKVNHPSPDSCLRNFLEEGGRLPEGC